jgi:hypothetical protein
MLSAFRTISPALRNNSTVWTQNKKRHELHEFTRIQSVKKQLRELKAKAATIHFIRMYLCKFVLFVAKFFFNICVQTVDY